VPRSRSPLEPRRWFDNSLPQTLQIALWLLYIDGVFLLLHFLDRTDPVGYVRSIGVLGLVVALGAVVAYPAGGFLIANGRRLGHHLAVLAAFSPFLLRLWAYLDIGVSFGISDIIIGGDYVQFMFDAALVALLLHPMSLRHVRIWLS